MDERQYKIIVIQKSEDESMAPKDSNEMAQNEVLTWNAGSANFSGQAAVAAVSKWQVEMISLLCGKTACSTNRMVFIRKDDTVTPRSKSKT